MYTLKPLLNIDNIETPNCMYKLKPIHNFKTNCKQSNSSEQNILKELTFKMESLMNNKNTSEVCSILESRQESILQKLNDLKNQLMSMRSCTAVCSSNTIASAKQETFQRNDINIVIHANPETIPESFFVLSNIWKNVVNMEFICYTHSTVAELPESAKKFQEKLLNAAVSLNGNVMLYAKISLIWKNDITQPELVSSPAVNIPIIGEVNIIRYLCRSMPNITNDLTNDAILDLCYHITNTNNLQTKQSLLQKLSSYLTKIYFGNNTNVSPTDAAVLSTVNQLKKLKIKLPANVEKWLKMMMKFC